jgi:uncharacterized membrane protein YgcG
VVGFEVSSVTRNGAPENYVTERLSNGVRIRIGSAERLIGRGRHEYVIAYRTTRQLGFFPAYDELYWNATGNGWTFTIDVAEARITLPADVPFRQTALYTGLQGAQGKDARVVEQPPGRIIFRTTRPLPPRHGLTVAVAWDKGVVAPPSSAQRAQWWLADQLPYVVGFVGLGILLGYYAFVWYRVGRDPPGGTIIPLFAPPNAMSAASVRYVRRMKFDDRCFTAAIVDLGVNGYLKLNDSGDAISMERRSGSKEIAPAERATWHKLFGARASLKLEQSNHQILGEAKSALQEGLTSAYADRLFHSNSIWSIVGLLAAVLLSGAVIVAVIFAFDETQAVVTIIGALCAMAGVAMAAASVTSWWSGAKISFGGIVGIVLATALTLVGVAMVAASARHWIDIFVILPPVMAAGFASISFYILKAPTREGRQVMDAIEGFRQYLGVAEEARLQALHPPEKTPQLFEKFLPHAIALDVENAWAKKFAGVLAAAAAAGAASAWYSGQNFSSNPVGFAERLGGDLSSTISSASTAPGSSDGGSGGGGSSGGGGGGGGGSGW